LGFITLEDNKEVKVRVFDGQHKAAAQVLLGVKKLPVRIFINPDLDVLLTTNPNAGTKLRQVAFDMSVQRHLGNTLYFDRIERYQREIGLSSDDYSFSERDLVNYYRGEFREMKRYILDSIRDAITHHPDNQIMQGKPISEDKLFEYRFPEPLWERIRIFIRNLTNLPLWVNRELASTVFGGKQNYEYWQTVFETGKTPQGFQVLAKPLNLMEMIKE